MNMEMKFLFVWFDKVCWDDNGFVLVIVQEVLINDVLMFVWMNCEVFVKMVEMQCVVYYLCLCKCLWFKGEELGYVQYVYEVWFDCDEDVVLLKVEQVLGIVCYIGWYLCFFQKFEGNVDSGDWVVVELVLKDFEYIYK